MKTVIRPETEMTDSGIDTVEKMPLSWSKIRLKNLVKIRTGNEDTQNSTPNGKYRFYVRSPIVERCDRYTFEGEAILVAGDGAGAGRIFHLVNGRYAVHQRVYCLSDFKYNAKFVHYYLENLFPFEMDKGSAQSTVPSMRLPMLLNFNLVLPGENECLKIVDYLDETCSKIDEIIAEAKASIDEYKELKQSVIFEAVTKGLDKNVEMKDSGNLAIGKIPKHWVKARVKNVATRITVGVVVTPANYFDDTGTVAFLRGINVKEYVINSEPMMYITEETNKELSKTIVHTNDLVIVRDGAIGVTAVVPEKYDGANVVSMIIVSLGSEYNHDYLCYVLNSYVGKIQFNLTKIGSALSHTSVSSVSNIEIPKPSLNEQIDIVNYLKGQHKKLDSLITEKESLINDLEAYKKSLIYEVVTGKRRVV